MNATALNEPTYLVRSECNLDGRICISISCQDYDAFSVLPISLEYKGQAFVRTGWNSDNGEAYYKTGVHVARGAN